MFNKSLPEKLRSLFHVLLAVFGSLSLAAPPGVAAVDSTILVAPPNGSDDTANIQAALDACVAHGPGCTVQLQAGKYLSRQLVSYNFQGTFKGMGKDRTSIEALYPLLVTLEPVGGTADSLCRPNTTTCLWPDLILFVNGEIHISDLALYELAPPGMATTPWGFAGSNPGYVGLFDVLSFIGQHANAYIDRIHMEGLPDPNNFVGFNVVNGAHYTGEFPRSLTPLDWYFLSGSYTVRNSSFKNMGDGVSQDAFVKSTRITIGGSPTTGNHFDGLCFTGVDMETLEESIVEISYNESSGFCLGGAAAWVVPWTVPAGMPFVPTSPTRYYIHDNTLFTTAQFSDGLFLLDISSSPFIDAAVWNNSIQLQNTLSEGIGVINTKGTMVLNNSITGSDAFDAIGLYSSTLDMVIHNSVSGVTIDSTVGNAPIFLDPGTSNDLVVCSSSSDTILNQGTDNMLVHCQRSEAAPAAAAPIRAASAAAHDRPMRKPSL
jgi:hypothetical protein